MVKHKRHDNFCIATAIAARVDRLSTHESCLPDVVANETWGRKHETFRVASNFKHLRQDIPTRDAAWTVLPNSALAGKMCWLGSIVDLCRGFWTLHLLHCFSDILEADSIHITTIAIEFMSIDSKIMTCTSSMQTQIALSDAATDSVENTVVQEIRFNSLNPDVTRMLSMALSPWAMNP